MTEPNQCHICGKLGPLFTVHTVQMVDMPAMMINVFYCKKCAQLVDMFEQKLAEIYAGERVQKTYEEAKL